jgi:cystathionine beta-lyase
MKYDFDEVIDRMGTDSIKWGMYPKDVIAMWVADMDFRSADPILEALQRRIDHGVLGYSGAAPELKPAIRERMKRIYQWDIKEDEILLTPGVVTGINVAIHAFSKIGEGILAQPPVYFHFLRDPVHQGRTLSDPSLVRKGDSYEIDFDAFEKSITERTQMFILCNPHNPVGRVFTEAELQRIADICLRHRLILCSDEIHCDLVYPGYCHTPIASLAPEIAECTITLMAPSKTYNVAGLGCAYAIIKNPSLRRTWQIASYGMVPGISLMGHTAALAALTEGQEWLDQVMVYLEGNRNFVDQYLREKMPAIRMSRIEATYLAWLDCRAAGISGNPGEFFLREARVALNNGADFGKGGEGHVRLNFACRRSLLAEGLDRMAAAIHIGD